MFNITEIQSEAELGIKVKQDYTRLKFSKLKPALCWPYPSDPVYILAPLYYLDFQTDFMSLGHNVSKGHPIVTALLSQTHMSLVA